MKYIKDDPDRWVITNYGSDFKYTSNELSLCDNGEYSVSCNWPTNMSFNGHNSRWLRIELRKLLVRYKESKDNFLVDYLNKEITLQYRMDPKYLKFISNELTLWLRTKTARKSYLDIPKGYIWFSDQGDLIACKMQWGKDK